jgi:quercetin dioxygenase-like cupin family protein
MAAGYVFIPDLMAEAAEQAAGILSRKLHDGDGVKAVLFSFAPGEALSEHTASAPASILILKGTARWRIGDDEFTCGPDSWLHLPANTPHSVEAMEPMTMLLLLVKQA